MSSDCKWTPGTGSFDSIICHMLRPRTANTLIVLLARLVGCSCQRQRMPTVERVHNFPWNAPRNQCVRQWHWNIRKLRCSIQCWRGRYGLFVLFMHREYCSFKHHFWRCCLVGDHFWVVSQITVCCVTASCCLQLTWVIYEGHLWE